MTEIVKKKHGGYRGGTRKGVPNRTTANAREAIATEIAEMFAEAVSAQHAAEAAEDEARRAPDRHSDPYETP